MELTTQQNRLAMAERQAGLLKEELESRARQCQ